MPTISGELNFVTSRAAHINEIWVRAPRVRTSTGGVVVTQNDRFPVKDGQVEFTCLAGPAILSLVSDGRAVDTVPIVVGESSSQTLQKAVTAAQVADGATQSEIEKLAAQAVHLIDTSTESASRAETAASGAAQSAKKSAESATDSDKSAKSASESASAASKSAGDASSSATAAKTAETKASSQASAAAKSATAAKADADRAAGVADSTSWKGDQLTVNGKTSPHLTGPKGDQGDRGERGPTGTVAPGEIVPLPREEIDLSEVLDGATGDATLVVNGGVATLHLNITPDFNGRSRVIPYNKWPWQYNCPRWMYSAAIASSDDDFGLIQLASNNLYLMNVEAGKTYRGTLTYALEVDVSAMSGPQGPKGDSGSSKWDDVTGKPSKFPPEDHKHTSADISDAVGYFGSPGFGNRVVKTHSSGHLHDANDPSEDNQLARKAYVDKVSFPREITDLDDIDLNDVTSTGTYRQNFVVKAKVELNYPSGQAGLLEVFNPDGSMVYQRYTEFGDNNKTWTRGSYRKSWSKWKQVAQDGHKHTVSEISDLPKIDYRVTGGALVKRVNDGQVAVPETPYGSTAATSKSYVDSRVKLVSSLPSSPESDVLYVIPE